MNISKDQISFESGMLGIYLEDFIIANDSEEVYFQAEIDEAKLDMLKDRFVSDIEYLYDNRLAVKEQILMAVHEYYLGQVYPQKSEIKDVFEVELSKIDVKNDIAKLVALHEVFIWTEEEAQDFGFSFSCDWDPEHGLGVRMVGSEIKVIGGASVSFELVDE